MGAEGGKALVVVKKEDFPIQELIGNNPPEAHGEGKTFILGKKNGRGICGILLFKPFGWEKEKHKKTTPTPKKTPKNGDSRPLMGRLSTLEGEFNVFVATSLVLGFVQSGPQQP